MKRPKETDCGRVRAALAEGRRGAPEESHLFGCAPCRTDARLAAAWRILARPEMEAEAAASKIPADERFVRGVLERVREERGRTARRRTRWAAAAALLFFFLAGAGEKLAASVAANAEDSYASMLTPSIDSFLPQ